MLGVWCQLLLPLLCILACDPAPRYSASIFSKFCICQINYNSFYPPGRRQVRSYPQAWRTKAVHTQLLRLQDVERAKQIRNKAGNKSRSPPIIAPVFLLSQDCLGGCEQIKKTQDEPQWIVAQRLLSHLQYLDSVKSSAKGLSLPKLEIKINRRRL